MRWVILTWLLLATPTMAEVSFGCPDTVTATNWTGSIKDTWRRQLWQADTNGVPTSMGVRLYSTTSSHYVRCCLYDTNEVLIAHSNDTVFGPIDPNAYVHIELIADDTVWDGEYYWLMIWGDGDSAGSLVLGREIDDSCFTIDAADFDAAGECYFDYESDGDEFCVSLNLMMRCYIDEFAPGPGPSPSLREYQSVYIKKVDKL